MKKIIKYGLGIALSLTLCNQTMYSQTETAQLKSRDQIDPKYTWNVADIYATDALWEADYKYVEENFKKYKDFEGKLGNSTTDLLQLIKFDEDISTRLGKLFLYAMLLKDLDLANSVNLSRHDRISQLYSNVSVTCSYIIPEILTIPRATLDKFMSESKDLAVYRQNFDNIFRTHAHSLPKEQEELLALAGQMAQTPQSVFSVFTNADMKMPVVKDENGNDIQLSAGRYTAAMYSTDGEYRKRVFKEFLTTYKGFSNTLATLFVGEIKTHIFNTKARKYDNCQAAALDANNIPVTVYDNLVKTVNENLAPLHRWARIKKKVLGLKEIHTYDVYVTLFPKVKKEFTYDQGVEICKSALKPLGTDYIQNLTTAFDNRWIDVYETKGKRSGAYSSGTTFGVHPYVLLNWNNQLNDVFTLAHEMGHNMHSYYTGKNQPYPNADYSIFVAEVASTCNEALLLDYLIANAKSKDEKLALIETYLTNITATFYRQTMFAEFEKTTHELTEKGEALSADDLTKMYKEITQKYWGPDMTVDDEEGYTWSRVPHFYYNFYVYQYATSYAASQVLAEKIKTEKQPAIDKYLAFLKAGKSDYPINVLKQAGVDMNSPEPVLKTIKKMNELLDEMERIMAEK
jgi:oligoendopeptidase F